MENANRETVVDILRKVTHAVKVYPFVVAFIQMIAMMLYNVLPESMLYFLDLFGYSSVVQIIFLLFLSKKLHLCKWHRLECVLPLFGVAAVMIDWMIYEFPIEATAFNVCICLMILCCSKVNAYHVFIKPNSRR